MTNQRLSTTGDTLADLRSHLNVIALMSQQNWTRQKVDPVSLQAASAGDPVVFTADPERGWHPLALVAAHGYEWVGSTLPARFTRGIPKHCYHNAWERVRRSTTLAYCEGYAMSSRLPLPVEHAWIVDLKTGLVIEPTWDTKKTDETFYYKGLIIPHDIVREARRRSGKHTIAVLEGEWARKGWFGQHGADATIAYTQQVTARLS